MNDEFRSGIVYWKVWNGELREIVMRKPYEVGPSLISYYLPVLQTRNSPFLHLEYQFD